MHDTSTLETLGDHCRRLSVVVVTICCAGTITACGSSSKSETTIASNGNSQGIKFAACMRAHGVPNFADPTSSQPSITSGAYSVIWGRPGAYVAVPITIDMQSPTFRQAATACKAPF